MNRPEDVLREAALSDVTEHAEQLRRDGWEVAIDVVKHDETTGIRLTVLVRPPEKRPKQLPVDYSKILESDPSSTEELNAGEVAERPAWAPVQ